MKTRRMAIIAIMLIAIVMQSSCSGNGNKTAQTAEVSAFASSPDATPASSPAPESASATESASASNSAAAPESAAASESTHENTVEPASDKTDEPMPAMIPISILTIQYIKSDLLDNGDMITGWSIIDENGAAIDMPVDIDEWFVNADLVKEPTFDDIGITNMFNGTFVGIIIAHAQVTAVLSIDNNDFIIDFSPGAQLATQKTANGYVLLPDETIALMPEPELSAQPDESPEPSPEPEPIDEWLTGIRWDGKALHMAAVQDLTISGISVFAGDKEYEADIIKNSAGDMGLLSGAVAWAGSSLSLKRNPVIIFEGTVASCEIDTQGDAPDRAVFYFNNGETYEKSL